MAESECKRDEDFNAYGMGGTMATFKAAQWCSDNGYYDHKIIDCGDWKFKASCSNSIPADWSTPMHDLGARQKGYTDRNHFARSNCKSKGYDNIDLGQWRDKGSMMFSIKCINPTPPPTTLAPPPPTAVPAPPPTAAPAPTAAPVTLQTPQPVPMVASTTAAPVAPNGIPFEMVETTTKPTTTQKAETPSYLWIYILIIAIIVLSSSSLSSLLFYKYK